MAIIRKDGTTKELSGATVTKTPPKSFGGSTPTNKNKTKVTNRSSAIKKVMGNPNKPKEIGFGELMNDNTDWNKDGKVKAQTVTLRNGRGTKKKVGGKGFDEKTQFQNPANGEIVVSPLNDPKRTLKSADYMTSTEKNAFNNQWKTNPKKALAEYMKLYPELESRKASGKGFWERNLVSGAVKFGTSGMLSTATLLNEAMGGSRTEEFEQLLGGETAYMQGTQNKNAEGGKAVEFAGSVVQGFAQFIPQVVMTAVNPYLGVMSMVAPAVGTYSEQARTDGANVTERLIYGGLGGTAEGYLQKVLFINKLLANTLGKNAVTGVVMDGVLNMAKSKASILKNIGISALGEASEEALIDPFTGLISKMTYDKDKNIWGEGGVIDPMEMAYDGLIGGIVGGGISAGANIGMIPKLQEAKATIDREYPQTLVMAYALPDTSVPVGEATTEQPKPTIGEKVKAIWNNKETEAVTEVPKYKSRVIAEQYRDERKQVSVKEVFELMEMVREDYNTYAEVMSQPFDVTIPEHARAITRLEDVDKNVKKTIAKIQETTTREEGLEVLKGYAEMLVEVSVLKNLDSKYVRKLNKAVNTINSTLAMYDAPPVEVKSEVVEEDAKQPVSDGKSHQSTIDTITSEGYVINDTDGFNASNLKYFKMGQDKKYKTILESMPATMSGKEKNKVVNALVKASDKKMSTDMATNMITGYNIVSKEVPRLTDEIEYKRKQLNPDARIKETKPAKKVSETIIEKTDKAKPIGEINQTALAEAMAKDEAIIELYDLTNKRIGKKSKQSNIKAEEFKEIIAHIKKVPWFRGMTFEFHDSKGIETLTVKEVFKRGYNKYAEEMVKRGLQTAEFTIDGLRTKDKRKKTNNLDADGNRIFTEGRGRIKIFQGGTTETLLEELIHELQDQFESINPEFADAISEWNNNYTQALIDMGYNKNKINANTLIEGFADAVVISEMGWADADASYGFAIDSSAVATIREMIGKDLFKALLGEQELATPKEERIEVGFAKAVEKGLKSKKLKAEAKGKKTGDNTTGFSMHSVDIETDLNRRAVEKVHFMTDVHAPDGVLAFEDSLPYHDLKTLSEARAFNSDKDRVETYKEIYAKVSSDPETILDNWQGAGLKVISFKKYHANGKGNTKTSGVVEVGLTQGCARTSNVLERILWGVYKKDADNRSCYGGSCFTDWKLSELFLGDRAVFMNIKPLSMTTPEIMRKMFEDPKFIKELNKGEFLRHGVLGDDSHTISSGLALEWLKLCREFGVTKQNVFISASYAPVTEEQYRELLPYKDILTLHFSTSGWFERNDIMIKVAEFQKAKEIGLDPVVRFVTNADNISGIDMNQRYNFNKALLDEVGVDQAHILETPYHDDRPEEERTEGYKNVDQKKGARSKPSGDFLNICCETKACRTCSFKCLNNPNKGLGLVNYYNKPDTSTYEIQENMVGKNIHDKSMNLYAMTPVNRTWEELPEGIAERNKDSKVLDENGNLAVMYHGTDYAFSQKDNLDFTIFNPNSHFGTSIQASIFASSDQTYANRIYPVYLNITKPKKMEDIGGGWDKAVRQAKADGYDGIKYLNRWEGVYDKKFDAETGFKKNKELTYLQIEKKIFKAFPRAGNSAYISDSQFLSLFTAEYSYIAFDPNQVKSIWNEHPTDAPEILYSMTPVDTFAPAFYSDMERILDKKLQNMVTPEQVKAIIKSNAKAEEIKWSGIFTYLNDEANLKNGKIVKADLLEWLRNNRFEIEEERRQEYENTDYYKMYGDEAEEEIDEMFDASRSAVITNIARNPESNSSDLDYFYNVLIDCYDTLEDKGIEITPTHLYNRVVYEALGVGKTAVANVPKDIMMSHIEAYLQRKKFYEDKWSAREGLETVSVAFKDLYTVDKKNTKNYQEFLFKAPNLSKTYLKDVHWGSTENVISHARTSDKYDEDGNRVLFLEEVQSDLHEDAVKRKGYDEPIDTSNVKFEVKYEDDWYNLYADGQKTGVGYGISYIKNVLLLDENNLESLLPSLIYDYEKQENLMDSDSYNKPPSAPYKHTWQEFVLKKMLRFACENGYDKLAWTTGDQQNSFYNLEKDVSEIFWSRSAGNPEKYFIAVYDKNRDQIINKDYVTIKDISAIVGSDIAKQIEMSDKQYESITGEGLKTGGTGMRNFYDIGGASSQNIPKTLEKFIRVYGKQWGASVSTSIVNDIEQPSMAITPEMKRSVLEEGQTFYSMKPEFTKQGHYADEFVKEVKAKRAKKTSSMPIGGDTLYVEVFNKKTLEHKYFVFEDKEIKEKHIARYYSDKKVFRVKTINLRDIPKSELKNKKEIRNPSKAYYSMKPAKSSSSSAMMEMVIRGLDMNTIDNAIDLIEVVESKGGYVDLEGNVTVYHATSKERAEHIRSTNQMVAREDGLFFSSNEVGQISGYGDTVIAFKIPAYKLVIDDMFDDEIHLRFPLKNRDEVLNVARYIQPKSIEKDNEGYELTEEQTVFYKKSKIRDKKGKLLRLYHNTNGTFDEFDMGLNGTGQGQSKGRGIYMCTNKHTFNDPDYGKNQMVLYANIENPFYIQQPLSKAIAYKIMEEYYGMPTAQSSMSHVMNQLTSGYYKAFEYIQESAKRKGISSSQLLQEVGFDGIIDGIEVIAFNSNQVKHASNLTPTKSSKLNYAMRWFKPEVTEEEHRTLMNRLSDDAMDMFGTNQSEEEVRTMKFASTYLNGNTTDKARRMMEAEIGSGRYNFIRYTNDGLLMDAKDFLKANSPLRKDGSRDYTDVEAWIKDPHEQTTNMMFAVGMLLAEHYGQGKQKGRLGRDLNTGKSLDIVEAITNKAKTGGQAIQCLSMWAKLSPEGIMKYATKLINESMTENERAEVMNYAMRLKREFENLDKEEILKVDIKKLIEEVKEETDPRILEAQVIANMLATAMKGDEVSRMTETIMDFAKKKLPNRSFSDPFEYVVDAIKNRKMYKDVWNKMSKGELWRILGSEERGELFETKMWNNTPQSFVDNSKLNKVIKKELEAMELSITDIVLESYTQQRFDGERLINNLMERADLNYAEADMLERKIRQQLGDLTESRKRAIAQNMLGEKKAKTESGNRAIDRLIKMSNIGALSDEEYTLAVANKLGIHDADPDFLEYLHTQAQELQTLEGREKIEMQAKIMEDIASKLPVSFWKKVSTIQTMAQLLNPVTALRNIVGNGGFAVSEYIAETFAVPLDIMAYELGKSPLARTMFAQKMGWEGQRVTLWRPVQRMLAQTSGFKEGFQQAVDEIHRGINTSLIEETRWDLPQHKLWQRGVLAELEKCLAYELRAFDRASYMSTVKDSLEEQMLIAGVDEPTVQMVKDAHFMGMYRTFQDDNVMSEFFTKFKSTLNTIGFGAKVKGGRNEFGLGDLALKYPKTPANLLMRSIEYSPLGLVTTPLSLLRNKDMSPYLRQKMGTLGMNRAFLGTLIWMTGMMMFSAGVITGGDDPEEDPNIKLLKKSLGISKYQINIGALIRWLSTGGMFGGDEQEYQDGDYLMSYSWFLPMGVGLSIGANIQDNLEKNKDIYNGIGDTIIASLEESTSAFVEQPMLTGLAQLFGVNEYDKEEKNIISGGSTLLKGMPASFYPSILRRINQIWENRALNVYNNDSATQTAVNKLIANIPYLNNGVSTPLGDIEAVEPYVTPFGEQSTYWDKETTSLPERLFNALLSPWFSANVKNDPLVDWTLKLNEVNPDRSTDLAPTSKVKVDWTIEDYNGEKIPVSLTPKENREMSEFRGRRMREEYQAIMDSYGTVEDLETSDAVIDELRDAKYQIGVEVKEEIARMKGIEL